MSRSFYCEKVQPYFGQLNCMSVVYMAHEECSYLCSQEAFPVCKLALMARVVVSFHLPPKEFLGCMVRNARITAK